jgi:hypothetical protein
MISSELKAGVKETLDIMTKVNFDSLSHNKSIEWNLALSRSCLRFSQEMTLLKRELSEVRHSKQEDTQFRDRAEFSKGVYLSIKKHAHKVFSKLIFPSHLEGVCKQFRFLYRHFSHICFASTQFLQGHFASKNIHVSNIFLASYIDALFILLLEPF